MRLSRFCFLFIVAYLLYNGRVLARSDSIQVVTLDSVTCGGVYLAEGWNYFVSHVGGDFFAQGEAYSLHFSKVGLFSMSGGFGLGAEFRVAPVFIGGIIGESGNEIPRPPSEFYFSSLYAGFNIRGYRIELGRVYGETSDWDPISPPLSVYKSYFAGIGRRYGSGFFFEPEIKFMFPVVATYYYHENIPGSYGYPGYDTTVATDNCGLRDLFFALTAKVGMGFGSNR